MQIYCKLELVTTFRPEECIYRVLSTLRDFNKAVYTPQVISIGPILQHDNKALKAVEDQKWRFMKDFFRVRIQKEKRKERLTTLLSAIKDDDAAI